ncbi:MAG: nucleoside deaminase [Dialister sp.]|nr:nucleoside deaminase [Dialister sp.]
MTDSEYMRLALREADKALENGEVPIGAVITYKGMILAAAHNHCEEDNDPFAHAEIIVLKKARQRLSRRRLTLCRLYVTIEPCPMCAGAILNAKIGRLIYGAPDKQYGGISCFHMDQAPAFNHTLDITSDILEAACRKRMDSFFASLRRQEK